jgi:hypothetical protein
VTRITLEDKPALGAVTGAGHLYVVLREDGEADGQGLVIRGGQGGTISGLLEVDAGGLLVATEDEYSPSDTELSRHARDITDLVCTGSWSAMVDFARGIDGVYDYELPFASGDRVHVANSNALIFSVLNAVGIDARTIDGIDPPNVDWYSRRFRVSA